MVQAWGQLEAAKAQIEATQAQVHAAEIALNGVREEARVGQRTTLDVLNAQQELVNARVALVTAQRDRVVASYTLLAAVGRLSPQVLGLQVPSLRSAACTTIRCATAGSACARRTGADVDSSCSIGAVRVHRSLHGATFHLPYSAALLAYKWYACSDLRG